MWRIVTIIWGKFCPKLPDKQSIRSHKKKEKKKDCSVILSIRTKDVNAETLSVPGVLQCSESQGPCRRPVTASTEAAQVTTRGCGEGGVGVGAVLRGGLGRCAAIAGGASRCGARPALGSRSRGAVAGHAACRVPVATPPFRRAHGLVGRAGCRGREAHLRKYNPLS